VILPADQAKAVARGAVSVLYLPLSKVKRPKTGAREAIQYQGKEGRETACHVIYGIWQLTTLRPLLRPEALKDRQQAGWRLGDGIVQMCDEWMRYHDARWPEYYADPCDPCDRTGIVDVASGGFPGPSPEERVCGDCGGAGWLYTEAESTERQILDRFEKRHADRPVYAVVVSVDHVEHPRILTPAGRPRGDELGYTTASDDLLEAGEAIPLSVQKAYSDSARKFWDELRKQRAERAVLRSDERRERQQERYKRAN
jgi:hypothetical protein